jgi:hypothetical protein
MLGSVVKSDPFHVSCCAGARSFARRWTGVAFVAAVCLGLVAIPSVALAQGPEAHLLSKTFGTASSTPKDPYPLTNPTDVAVDNSSGPSNGDIYVGNPSADEQQTIEVRCSGGTFTLTFEGQSTIPIACEANTPVIEQALAALPAVGTGNDFVGGTFSSKDLATVVFTGKFTEVEVEQMGCNASGLTGSGVSCTITTTVHAVRGNDIEKFGPSGEFLLMFGGDVNKTAAEEHRSEAERNVCPAPGHPGDVCQYGTRGHLPGSFESEFEPERAIARPNLRESHLFLAVDGSSGGGDVYVGDPGDHTITKFTSSGVAERAWGTEGQIGGIFSAGPFGRETFEGVAVDPAGDLFVWGPETAGIDVRSFDRQGNSRSGSFGENKLSGNPGLAIDEDGNLYTGAAVDPVSNDHYILQRLEGGFIEHFAFRCHGEEVESEKCTPLEEFGFGQLARPEDVAAGSGGTIYVANTGATDVAVFTSQLIESPSVSIESPSEISYTSAHVAGAVNPHGQEASCRFEYVTDAHFKAKAEGFGGRTFKTEAELNKAIASESYQRPQYQPCATSPGSGTSTAPVEADLHGLVPGTEYHVRLIARSRLGASASSAEANPTFTTKAVLAPAVMVEAVGGVTATSAHFKGQIDPNAPEPAPTSAAVEAGFKVNWEFQCTPARAVTPPCRGELGGTLAADDKGHEVTAEASGLEPGETYGLVLVGSNAGTTQGKAGPLPFTTPAVAPRIDETSVSGATETEATLNAQIDPGGAPTSYRFQYISEAQYEADGTQFGEGAIETTEAGPVGEAGDNIDKEVSAGITGLTPEAAYRYRVIAQNAAGPVDGPAEGLFTYAPSGFSGCLNEQLREENNSKTLPDCRAYEQVSPADNATVDPPETPVGAHEGYLDAWYPMQSSADGEAVTYVGEPASSGQGCGTGNSGNGEGDEHLAIRGKGGWSATDIQPCGSNPATYFEAFSATLDRGIIGTAGDVGASKERPLDPSVETNCGVLYQRASESGQYSPLYTTETTACHHAFYVGSSANGEDEIFESTAKKTEGAQEATGAKEEQEGRPAKGHENIYDSVGGQLHLVNVLPGGKADPNASIGQLVSEEESKYAEYKGEIVNGQGVHIPSLDTSGVVSSDGSRIFWTNLATGIVYVRENPTQEEESASSGGKCTEPGLACTVQVSAHAASYQTASPDGRYAYYIEAGQLWRFDLESETREALTPANAEVQDVIGVNQVGEDGAYLYFVAAGKLSADAEARKCETAGESEAEAREENEGLAPAGRGCNLYVLHQGVTTLVASLSPIDDEFGGGAKSEGAWRAALGMRSAELTSDGAHLSFLSTRRLTNYRNVVAGGAICGASYHHQGYAACPEVYLYDAQTERLSCASCAPSGAPPVAGLSERINEPATYLPGDFGSLTHMRRWISADGDRVFFDSVEPLLARDTNGVQDVYEWERAGSGSCTAGSNFDGGGCLYLLSDGAGGSRGSYLLDADETGDNVFFVSRTGLVPGGGEEKPNLFDARVDGGFKGAPGEIVQPPECKTAEECKEPSPDPPVESFPATAAFSGSGNLVAPLEVVKPAEKPVVRKLTRAQQLAKALKTCRKDRSKKQRAKCEMSAHRKYSAKSKKKTKSAKKSSRNGGTK